MAAAGGTAGLNQRDSIACLATILVCLAASPWLRQKNVAMLRTPAEYSPEVLAQKARDLAARFGYGQKPADRAVTKVSRTELTRHLRGLPSREWGLWLAAEGPGLVRCREARIPVLAEPLGTVTEMNPAPVDPAMPDTLSAKRPVWRGGAGRGRGIPRRGIGIR